MQPDDKKHSLTTTGPLKLWSDVECVNIPQHRPFQLLIFIYSPRFQNSKLVNNISKNIHFYNINIENESNAACCKTQQFIHALAICFEIMAFYLEIQIKIRKTQL